MSISFKFGLNYHETSYNLIKNNLYLNIFKKWIEFHKLKLNVGEIVEIHNINLKFGTIFGQNFINYFEIYQNLVYIR
jgi:hypothetical protein